MSPDHTEAAPNNDMHRSRRSKFLTLWPLPFGGPVMSSVRHLCSTRTWLMVSAWEPHSQAMRLPASLSWAAQFAGVCTNMPCRGVQATLAGAYLDVDVRRAVALRRARCWRDCAVGAQHGQSGCCNGFHWLS